MLLEQKASEISSIIDIRKINFEKDMLIIPIHDLLKRPTKKFHAVKSFQVTMIILSAYLKY